MIMAALSFSSPAGGHLRRSHWRRPLSFILVTALIALAAGCELPDVQPFAAGVAGVHQGVDRSGIVFRDSASRILGSEHPDVNYFVEHWEKRRMATEALVRYADALADIVEASNRVDQNVEAFGQAVDDLGGSVGLAGFAGSTAFRIGGEFYKLGEKVAAYHTLARAVEGTQGAVVHICRNILMADLTDMRSRLGPVEQAFLVSLETTEIEDEAKLLGKLKAQRARLYEELTEDWDGHHETHLPALRQLDELMSPIQARLDENERRQRQETEAILSQAELFTRTIEAIDQVAVAHQELARALREGRQMSTRNLAIAAVEISETITAIEKIKEQQND